MPPQHDGGGFGGGVMLLAAWSASRGGREVVTAAVGGGCPENGRSGAGKPKRGRRWQTEFAAIRIRRYELAASSDTEFADTN
ncbi:hypothetical protein Tco_0769163 [Tanacetum coccineum]|uniref:Secreted protein n=1 Tax=Tanacetum coccineum TaxID=301880 RepID=A0ABQ4ZBH5_9ASTR